MCGLVATLGEVRYEPFMQAIAGARRRGPHAHGWAWLDSAGWRVKHGLGPLQDPPRVEAYCWIGHSRLATSTSQAGGLPDVEESQPLATKNIILAHNGASDDERLVEGWPAPADSNGLLNLLAIGGLGAIVSPGTTPLFAGQPHAMIVYEDERLWGVRIDGRHRPAHPLFAWSSSSGTIVASVPPGPGSTLLPVGATQIGAA